MSVPLNLFKREAGVNVWAREGKARIFRLQLFFSSESTSSHNVTVDLCYSLLPLLSLSLYLSVSLLLSGTD